MSDKKDKITYTPEALVAGFGGAVSFSPAAAKAAAAELNKADDLGSADPDDAARAVQRAMYEATGLRVSIDTCLAALTSAHAQLARQGVTVGFTDQPGAARGESSANGDGGQTTGQGSGTAAATGAASVGAGAADAGSGKK